MPLQKLSGVAIFASLQECGFSRATKSADSQSKIRFAFHFVERNQFFLQEYHEQLLKTLALIMFMKYQILLSGEFFMQGLRSLLS